MAITSVNPLAMPPIRKETISRAQRNYQDASVGTPASTITNFKTILGGGFSNQSPRIEEARATQYSSLLEKKSSPVNRHLTPMKKKMIQT